MTYTMHQGMELTWNLVRMNLNLLFKKLDSKAKYMCLAPSALSKMYEIIHLGYVLLSL